MELISWAIAFNSDEREWMQPAEMLCAELYAKLGHYDSAEEVCRQISTLYKNTREFEQAQALLKRIKKLRSDEAVKPQQRSDA